MSVGLLALANLAIEGVLRFRGRFRRMKIRHDLARQRLLRRHGLISIAQLGDLGSRHIRQQFPVAPHQLVADAHDFAEHHLRRLRDADVVALRLRHLLDAVGAFQQRRGGDDLRRLPGIALHFAAHQQIEFLIGAAQSPRRTRSITES